MIAVSSYIIYHQVLSIMTFGDEGAGMTSVVGKIQAFNPQTERFSTYVERLKLYFNANSVVEVKKVLVFLTCQQQKLLAPEQSLHF